MRPASARPASARGVSSASVVLHALARHGVLHALVQREHGRIARAPAPGRCRPGGDTRTSRDRGWAGAGTGDRPRCARCACSASARQVRPAHPARSAAWRRLWRASSNWLRVHSGRRHRAVTGVLLPDVHHRAVAVGQQLFLAGGAAAEQRDGQGQRQALSPAIQVREHGFLLRGDRPCGLRDRSRWRAAFRGGRRPWRRAGHRRQRTPGRRAC